MKTTKKSNFGKLQWSQFTTNENICLEDADKDLFLKPVMWHTIYQTFYYKNKETSATRYTKIMRKQLFSSILIENFSLYSLSYSIDN